jgi:hypothetical protein
MRIHEIILEKTLSAPKKSQCNVGRAHLSNVRYAQCVGRGWLKHDSDHTDGTGKQGVKGSGKTQRGRYIKSEKFGGPNKYYPGSKE